MRRVRVLVRIDLLLIIVSVLQTSCYEIDACGRYDNRVRKKKREAAAAEKIISPEHSGSKSESLVQAYLYLLRIGTAVCHAAVE